MVRFRFRPQRTTGSQVFASRIGDCFVLSDLILPTIAYLFDKSHASRDNDTIMLDSFLDIRTDDYCGHAIQSCRPRNKSPPAAQPLSRSVDGCAAAGSASCSCRWSWWSVSSRNEGAA